MRVGSFDSGQQAANPESPQHSLATALATIVEHLSNQNSQRNIFHSECHRGVGVGLYHSYWQEAFGVSWLLAAKPLPSNQTEYHSNRFARPISLHQNIVERWGLVYTFTLTLELHDWQLPSYSLATKQSTLATVLQDQYLCIRTSYRDGGWLFWLMLANRTCYMLHMLAVNSYMLIALS